MMPRTCRNCRLPLEDGARLCRECKSYQGCVGLVMQWGTLAGSLVAALSLATGAVSLYRLAFPGKADVSIVAHHCGVDSLHVTAHNTGDEPAVIQSATVQAMWEESKGELLWLEIPKTHWVIGGKEQTTFEAGAVHRSIDGQLLQILPQRPEAADCQYRVEMTFRPVEQDRKFLRSATCACP